jgi:hypothetical protein
MRFKILPLEERIVLDAAFSKEIADGDLFDIDDISDFDAATIFFDGPSDDGDAFFDHNLPSPDSITTAAPYHSDAVKVLVIASDILDAEYLEYSAQYDVHVITYDPMTSSLDDIVTKIEEALHDEKADALAFATHGSGGLFSLTSDVSVSLQSLQDDTSLQNFWSSVASNMHEDGRIDLLACSLTSNNDGLMVVDALEAMTSRTVAASDDLTGNPLSGGDWYLETEAINADIFYFSANLLSQWQGSLEDNVAPAISGLSSSITDEESSTVFSGSSSATMKPASPSLNFGESVAVSGSYAVASEPDADKAYFFQNTGSAWSELGSFSYPADRYASTSNTFGKSVAIDGDYALAGDPGVGYNNPELGYPQTFGEAYLFFNNGGTWEYSTALYAHGSATPGEGFGDSVSISGDYAIVGAPDKDYNGTDSGGAYIFHNNGSSWDLVKELYQGDTYDNFGADVAIYGDYALVGATENSDSITYVGSYGEAAYLYHLGNSSDPTSWTLVDTLTPSGTDVFFGYGFSVDLSDTHAIVGSYYESNGATYNGAAYIYELSDTSNETEVTATVKSSYGTFGYSVAIDGDEAMIGAKKDGSNTGAAYLFSNTGSSWVETSKHTSSSIYSSPQSGYSVAIDDGTHLFGGFANNQVDTFSSFSLSISDGNDSSGAHPMEVTVETSDSGSSLDFSTTAGITFTDAQGDSYVVMEGTLSDLNAALDSLSYTPGDDFYGTDTLTITVDDLGYIAGSATASPLTGTLDIDITVNNINDAPSLDTNTGATFDEGAVDNIITAAMLLTGDSDNTPSQRVYTVTAKPTNGTLYLNDSELLVDDTFTQADIDNNLLSYDHDDTETTSDSFSFNVTDGEYTVSATSFAITVTPVNDAPTLDINAEIALGKGTTSNIITSSFLSSSDIESADATLEYTVTTLPSNGAIKRDGTTLAVDDTFTQGDIDNDLITYDHDDSETTSDGFSFTVGDGVNTSDAAAFSINVTQPPAITINGSFTTKEESALSLYLNQTFDYEAFHLIGADNVGSVATSGDYVYIGNTGYDSDTITNLGAVHVFEKTGNTYTEVTKLFPDGGAEYFGSSVKTYGDYIFVSAYQEDSIENGSGAVYVFKDNGGSWEKVAKLKASDVSTSDTSYSASFGRSIDVYGNYLIIGADSHDKDGANSIGQAYIFEQSGDSWAEIAILSPEDLIASDYFGNDVAIYENYALVSANGKDEPGSANAGAVYVYQNSNGSWSQVAKLAPDDSTTGDYFGGSIDITEGRIIVGAHGRDGTYTDEGKAFIFEGSGSSWTQTEALSITATVNTTRFGTKVSLLEDYAIVGSSGWSIPMRIYKYEDSSWSEVNQVTGINPDLTIYMVGRNSITYDPENPYTIYVDHFENSTDPITNGITVIDLDCFRYISVSDTDAPTDMTLSMEVSHGILSLGDTTGVTVNDADGDGYFELEGSPEAITTVLTTASYTPETDFFGEESLSIIVTDPGDPEGAITHNLTISISNVNDDPILDTNIGLIADEGSSDNVITTSMISSHDQDNTDTELYYKIITTPTHGTIKRNGVILSAEDSFSQEDLSQNLLTYNHDGSEVSLDSFSFTLSDGMTSLAEETFTITVNPVNDTPEVIVTGLLEADEDADFPFPGEIVINNKHVDYGSDYSQAYYTIYDLDVHDDYAIMGVQQENSNKGAAYIFEKIEGTWTQVTRLAPNDPVSSHYFGCSAAIYGDLAIVGAYGDDTEGSDAGAAYVFTRDIEGTWSQTAKLTAEDGYTSDNFSKGNSAISLYENYALIGAYRNDDGGSSSGSAYLFEYEGSSWTEVAKLIASDDYSSDNFGYSVDLHGDYAIIGSYGDDDKGSASGSAYIFDVTNKTGTTWTQDEKITASDGYGSDFFGYSVAITNGIAVVGAYGEDDEGSSAGAAYIFEGSGSSWSQTSKLLPSDLTSSDEFGYSVDTNGNKVLVGAYKHEVHPSGSYSYTGAAYVFEKSEGSWSQAVKISAPSTVSSLTSIYFGRSVALDHDGNTALISSQSAAYSGFDTLSLIPRKLSLYDPDTPTGTITTSLEIEHGILTLGDTTGLSNVTGNGTASIFFEGTVSDINASLTTLSYTPDADFYGIANLTVTADDDTGDAIAATEETITITVVNVNDLPSLDTNSNLIIDKGDTGAIITSSHLTAADSDNAVIDLTYTVTVLPSHGTLKRDGVTLVVDDTFSQEDLNNNLITYDNDNSYNATDSFSFILADGKDSLEEADFSISVSVPTSISTPFDIITDEDVTSLLYTYEHYEQGQYIPTTYSSTAFDFDDNFLFIGDKDYDTPLSNNGAVHIYEKVDGEWSFLSTITPSDSNSNKYFGSAVAISGDYAAIGAYGDNASGTQTGAAYIFGYDGTSWTQKAKLQASDKTSYHNFAYDLDIYEGTVVIGAYGDSPTTTYIASGAAYVFTGSGTSWIQSAKLKASDYTKGDQFGERVGITDGRIIVGSRLDDDYYSSSGSAYIFSGSGSSWSQETKLVASDRQTSDYFGSSVAISGNIAVVGAYGEDANSQNSAGSIYVFEYNGSSWGPGEKIVPSDSAAYDYLSGTYQERSLGITGDKVFAGSKASSGTIYVYSEEESSWEEEILIPSSEISSGAMIGKYFAVHDR